MNESGVVNSSSSSNMNSSISASSAESTPAFSAVKQGDWATETIALKILVTVGNAAVVFPQKYVVYLVQVEIVDSAGTQLRAWTVKRRYSQFYELQSTLLAQHFPGPVLPKRHLWQPWKTWNSEALIAERTIALDLWIKGVVCIWHASIGPTDAASGIVGNAIEDFLSRYNFGRKLSKEELNSSESTKVGSATLIPKGVDIPVRATDTQSETARMLWLESVTPKSSYGSSLGVSGRMSLLSQTKSKEENNVVAAPSGRTISQDHYAKAVQKVYYERHACRIRDHKARYHSNAP